MKATIWHRDFIRLYLTAAPATADRASRSHVTGPSELRTDNMGARDLSYNPEHHSKIKRVERRHFYVRDMVEKFEITVPFVRTANNTADCLHHASRSSRSCSSSVQGISVEFRRIIMNIPDSID